MVSQPSKAALTTKELRLRTTVSLCYKATLWAGARRVPWIDRNQRDACECGLVFQEGPELLEGPGMSRPSLIMPNCYSLAYTFQVFEGQAERVSLGRIH